MVQDSLGKGRLRSAWTHKVEIPTAQGDAGGSDGMTLHDMQQPLLPGDYAHPQLHHLHHHSSPPQHGFSSKGGAMSAGGAEAECDTPKKVTPALSFLQQQQQQLYSSRRRPFFTGVDREILCNALACAGASMADPLMSMVDSYYAGKLGTTALAALGSNGALFSVLYFLCFTALAVLCTQAMASANSRGDAEGCGRGFIQAATATLLVSSVLVVVLLSIPEVLLGVFQTDAEVLALAKTYCMIRALSLPAALSINVSQAAFRSMLDLTTPFCIVMAVNAANFLLNELLMVVFPYGMAGCGWASVVSQYMGAVLFAAVIYRRRHKFGIPEALACAEDRFYEQLHLRAASTGGSSTLVARKLDNRSAGKQGASAAAPGSGAKSPHKRQPGRAKRHSRASSGNPSPRRGISPRRSRESSGTLRIDVTAFEQQLAKANGNGALDDNHGNGPDQAVVYWDAVRGSINPNSPSRRRVSRGTDGAASAAGFGGQVEVLSSTSSGNVHHRHHPPQQQQWCADSAGALEHQAALGPSQHTPQRPECSSKLSTAAGVAAHAGGSSSAGSPGQQRQQGGSSGGCFQLHRWDSTGSESKLPRYLVGGGSSTTWGRLLLLLRSLDWRAFVRKFAGMTTRGMLILSTYTTANMVAAKGGTVMMAAHQVVQQQQQLQMSFAWSFLHVGQSMTANLFHSTSAVSGPKAARRLSERIVSWALWSCVLLACGTYTFRTTLPTIFTKDEEVQQLVLSAALPAAVMLGLGWNNALEGCLLAADDQPYVVRMYPCAVAAALMQLARCYWLELGLPGVWVALMTYYLVLLVGFAARYWMYRGKL